MNHFQRFPILTALLFSLFVSEEASAQFIQQGTKLVGTGAVGEARQGWGVSLSSDGNTAIVGAPNDSNDVGAAWVFTRNGDVWSQQGGKLVGKGVSFSGHAGQGWSTSLSRDGNTIILGGALDSTLIGAVWVFTRSGSLWIQQGGKLVGTGVIGASAQGYSVSLSSDGNTAIVGGPFDNGYAGAAWIFIRSGGVWSQQGSKLVGTGAVGTARQGQSVSLSADGNTAIVGGYSDNSSAGAAWVFTRAGGVWSQQGSKLVGTGSVGGASQGYSVSLSADGNTAIVGGPYDNSGTGAAWVFTRTGGVWTQQGSKFAGTGAAGGALQGYSVSLSSDGYTAIVGGPLDNGNAGAVWVFMRSGDVWSQQGSKLVGTGAAGNASQGYSVSLSGDGTTAILGGHTDGSNAGAAWVFVRTPTLAPGWKLVTVGTKALTDVCFVDSLVGWAVGRQGSIFKSTDGGNSWVKQVNVTSKNLNAVHFTSSLIGYAVGDSGAVLRTTDGGESWGAQWGFTIGLRDVYAASSTEAFITDGMRVYRSTDSGTQWFATGASGAFYEFFFLSGLDGWAAGGSDIWHTTNGTTWTKVSGGGVNYVWCIAFITDNVGFASSFGFLGYYGSHIGRTTDGGQTYAPISVVNAIVIDMEFPSANEGWASGVDISGGNIGSGTVYHTLDGGATWQRDVFLLAPNFKPMLSRMHFIDQTHGWVAGGIDTSLGLIAVYRAEPAVSVEGATTIPGVSRLSQNYPNPFNPSTTIGYALPHRGHVSLVVYNTLGQQIVTLVQGEEEAGYHELIFDASGLSSGVYFYRLTAGSFVQTRKLLLLR